jgi:hypothetical protein
MARCPGVRAIGALLAERGITASDLMEITTNAAMA